MPRGKSSSARSEFDGTENDGGKPSAVVDGPSEPIEPDAAAGTGNGSGNHSGERDSFGTEFDASIHTGERTANGAWAKRRGRKAGGSSGPRAKASKADLKDAVEGLTKTLVILHAGIASVTRMPELVIDQEEGRMLAAASANVMEEFDLKPDPKVQAIVGLVIAGATVYGPRVYMIQARKAQEKAENSGTGKAGVYTAEGQAAGTTDYSHVN